MPLIYIIDGYNLINHFAIAAKLSRHKDPRAALAQLIGSSGACGSAKNKVLIVFDGYPPWRDYAQNISGAQIFFAGSASADARIKKIVEEMANPRLAIVVSDDKEVKFFARACRARSIGVEEFMQAKKNGRPKRKDKDEAKDALAYSQIEEINRELRRAWLE